MQPLTTENIISLYAPLTGVVVLAFWVGVQTGRLTDVIRRVLNLESKAEAGTSDDIAAAEGRGEVKAKLEALSTGQKHIERDIAGIQRTLANMMSGKGGAITVFEQERE